MKTQQECKTGHTPTPWTADIINNWPESEEKAYQEFMLRAVNSHEALLEVAKMVLRWTGVLTSEDKLKIENAIRQAEEK